MSVTNLTFTVSGDCARFNQQVRDTIKVLGEIGEQMRQHEEQWRCELPGQWPDRFTLLNRYVRTGIQAPYIFND